MSNAKHTYTPGPWELDGNDIFANDDLIACAYGFINKKPDKVEYPAETYANARLIAAAPELLAALNMLFGDSAIQSVCHHEGADVLGRVKGTWGLEAEQMARAAIAKATGA